MKVNIRIFNVAILPIIFISINGVQAQNHVSGNYPKDTVMQSCVLELPECATPSNPQLNYHSPLNWPDSLVTEGQYFVWVDFDSLTSHPGKQRLPVDRYEYFVKWPTETEGIIELGPCGRMGFVKKDGFLTCEFIEKGRITNFSMKIESEGGPGTEIYVTNGNIQWIGRTLKGVKN